VLYSWNYDQVQWLPADPEGNTKTRYGLSALPTVFKPANDILPSVANTGYADFAFSRMPAIATNNEHQFSSSLTWTRGSHIIKFGGQHIRNYKDEIDSITDGGDRGTYDFGVSASAFDNYQGPAGYGAGGQNPAPRSYHLPSARLRFDFSKRLPPQSKTGWALFAYGDNLTNRQVWMPEWGGNPGDSIPVFRGRTVYFGLEMTIRAE